MLVFKGCDIFRLLCKDECRWQLEYIDLSGCSQITDAALRRIAQSLTPLNHAPSSSSLSSPKGGVCGRGGGETPQLRCLILSGCYKITDEGLRYVFVCMHACVYACMCLHEGMYVCVCLHERSKVLSV